MSSLLLLVALPLEAAAHGRMTYPPNRVGGTLEIAGKDDNCKLGTNSGGLKENHLTCGYQTRDSKSVQTPTNCNCSHMTGHLIHTCPSDADCSKVNLKDEAWTKPWTAPGKTKLWSPCGVNGGHKDPKHTDKHNKPYDEPWNGLELPRNEQLSDSRWVMGKTAKVAFTITKHHGGGYQWRLCPGVGASSSPDDTCFEAHPLKFATDDTVVHWTDGKEKSFRAIQPPGSVVTPVGSDWRVIQIPMTTSYKNKSRQPPCDGCHGKWGVDGDDVRQEWDFSLVDLVHVPTNIPAGPALLQWRWDNEHQDQVWTNCADIEIVAGGPAPPSPPSPSPSPSPTGSEVMNRGDTLKSGEMLVSKSGNALLKLQADGNLVLRNARTDQSLWHSATTSSDARFEFQQSDGNLVLRDTSGTSMWSSGKLPTAAEAKVEDDCNFVVRDQSGQSLWSTDTSCSETMFV